MGLTAEHGIEIKQPHYDCDKGHKDVGWMTFAQQGKPAVTFCTVCVRDAFLRLGIGIAQKIDD